ncbi:MAG: alpha-2-macroglobulin family protein [Methylomonas sp.]|jgi:hypothetical protein
MIGIIGMFMLLLALPCPLQAGSPFYLTAERSFSNAESPQIRLDYTIGDQPMLIRVLKADNLDRFLDGQFNISRSYEQPVSQLNPGHYFSKGLNQAKSPLQLLRGMLDVDFRKSMKNSPYSHSIVTLTRDPLARTPQQLLIAPPAGFKVVSENFLDLQHNGRAANDLGWWFGPGYWDENQYKVRTIDLEPLPDGVYLLQAVQGKAEAQCLLQVSSLAVQVKQSSEQLLVRVMNRDLQPVAKARVSYRDGRGQWRELPQITDNGGELSFQNPDGVLDGKLLVRVEAPAADGQGARTALTSTDFLPAQSNDDSVFVMTDRPIFKPGETFFYKGLVRARRQGELELPEFKSRRANVSLISADGKATGLQAGAELSDFASFSGSFALDSAQAPGLYRLLAEIEQKIYGGEFRVRDYIKPTFYLEWLDHSAAVSAGQPFKLKFRAKRYSGGIPQDLKFEVFLYRKKFETPEFVREAGAGLAAGDDYFGQIKSAAPLSQPQRLYSSLEARNAADLSNPWDSAAKADANGDGEYEFTAPSSAMTPGGDQPQEWIYTLMVRAQDQSGATAVLNDTIYATLSEAQPALTFNKSVAPVGDKDVELLLQSSYANGNPAPHAGGVVDVTLEQAGGARRNLVKLAFTSDGQGRQRLKIPPLENYGRLTAVAKLESLEGRTLAHPASSLPAVLVAAGAGGEAVTDSNELELYTPSLVLSPGEKIKVFAILPKDWGRQNSGPVWETIAGQRIFQNRSTELKGRSAWFELVAKPEFGTGFYHTVSVPLAGGKYKEQTLGFRIVPWEKRLKIDITPLQAEAEPLKPTQLRLEVKRADGSPAADTELALSIVDKAVYAVQPEFRPGLFDFFYPLQRNNLATFYSDELQGYGYADLLRKPNFSLSALKSQSKLAKKAMRDTAGWFPHLVTDANGAVTVTVDMPANITEWLITAAAADKNGRLGENTGQFRTVADVAVDVISPRFLRAGDEVELAVKLNNQLDKPVTLQAKAGLPEALVLQEGEPEKTFSLAAKGEQLWPLRINAKQAQGVAGVRVALSAPAGVRVGGADEFEIPLQAAALPQMLSARTDANGMRFDYPDSAVPDKLTVRITTGLLGAALQSAAYLAQYPYGCTEQLAHSILPNLALLDLAQHAGLTEQQLGPLADSLKRAQNNAVQGIRKLKANQKADGGFSLWPGESAASLPVTLIAMHTLQYAQQLNIEGVNKVYNQASDWLTQQGQQYQSGPLDNLVLDAYAQLSVFGIDWRKEADFITRTARTANASSYDLIAALHMLLKYQNNKWHPINKAFAALQGYKDYNDLLKDLSMRLRQNLEAIDLDNYPAASGEFYNQMGFNPGLPSLLSAGLDVLEQTHGLSHDTETKLKQYLLKSQRNGYWTSTYDTAQVIFNTRQIWLREAEEAKKAKPNQSNRLATAKNGVALGRLTAIPGGYIGEFSGFDQPVDLHAISLSELKADEAAAATLSVSTPYADVTPRAEGLELNRGYFKITAAGAAALDINQELKVGDMIVSQLLVKRAPVNNPSQQVSDFVVIEDGVPALAESMENDGVYLADAKIQAQEENYWSAIKQTLRYPDRIVRVANLKPGGELKLYQVLRLARAGKAATPPARGFDMYNEAVQGNTAAASIAAVK